MAASAAFAAADKLALLTTASAWPHPYWPRAVWYDPLVLWLGRATRKLCAEGYGVEAVGPTHKAMIRLDMGGAA